jgi:exopolysaccharide biosynthesis predicted pyruvyltransferase EpsI
LNKKLQNTDVTLIKEKVALGLGLATQGLPKSGTVNTSALDTDEGLKYAKSRAILMWREQESYEEALRLYPFVSNMLVPDMAFQLGPYAPIRNHPDEMLDIIIFLRKDHESKIDSTRSKIQKMLPKADMTFEIVDWPDRLEIFHTTDYFFTNSAIELLSLGKVVVCDRLHASILSYLSGIPFVYIDQVSGKITKTLSASLGSFDGCMEGKQGKWGKAKSLEEALKVASKLIEHV